MFLYIENTRSYYPENGGVSKYSNTYIYIEIFYLTLHVINLHVVQSTAAILYGL